MAAKKLLVASIGLAAASFVGCASSSGNAMSVPYDSAPADDTRKVDSGDSGESGDGLAGDTGTADAAADGDADASAGDSTLDGDAGD